MSCGNGTAVYMVAPSRIGWKLKRRSLGGDQLLSLKRSRARPKLRWRNRLLPAFGGGFRSEIGFLKSMICTQNSELVHSNPLGAFPCCRDELYEPQISPGI